MTDSFSVVIFYRGILQQATTIYYLLADSATTNTGTTRNQIEIQGPHATKYVCSTKFPNLVVTELEKFTNYSIPVTAFTRMAGGWEVGQSCVSHIRMGRGLSLYGLNSEIVCTDDV